MQNKNKLPFFGQTYVQKSHKDVITSLQLNIPIGTPIFIGDSNEKHIKNRHPYDMICTTTKYQLSFQNQTMLA